MEAAERSYFSTSPEPLHYDMSMGTSHHALASFFSGLTEADTRSDGLVPSFVTKLTASVPEIRGVEIQSLWIPALRRITTVLDCSAMTASELPHHQQLFTTFLKAYIERYVGREPVHDGNLVRPAVSCRCGDCERLNEFLVDPRRKVDGFAVKKKRRAHLHRRLEAAMVDCTHETEHMGSPQTLVVTKTCTMVPVLRQAWAARRTEAIKELVRFDQDKLKKLLGDEYTAITNMDRILAAGSARHTLAETSQSGSSRAPVVGEKRKFPEDIDVIDLTGD